MRCAVVLVCLVWRASWGARIDELFRARCAAACIDVPKKEQFKCESSCSLVTHSKPGDCPSELGKFEGACITGCSQDRDCAATEKCCTHRCGTTCQPAVHLDTYPGLPTVPVNVTVSEARRPRSKVVRWALPSATNGRVLYVLQERRHLGETLQPQLFGSWRGRNRRRQTRFVLTDLTPAYWYQVRVAAVNPNGTRGFSDPSLPFNLKAEPNKPGEPRNLTVVNPGWVNDTLCAELRWRRPASDIPLHHYKVSWSHCVKTGDLDNPDTYCKAKSIIVNHESVSYKTTYFTLRDLKPSSLYFIQVQAVTVPYGLKKKLFSEKAVVFINTNKYKNATYDWKPHSKSIVKNLRKTKIYRPTANTLEVQVEWASAPGRFSVMWAPTSNSKCAANKRFTNVITEDFHFELDHLDFGCKYQVSVKAVGSNKSANMTFTTPLCSDITSKYPCP